MFMTASLSPLAPAMGLAMASVVIPLLNLIGRKGARAHANDGVFGYSVGMRIFAWLGVISYTLFPLIVIIYGHVYQVNINTSAKLSLKTILISYEAIGAAAMIGCMYIDRFIVQLKATYFIYGSFSRKKIMYSDMKYLETYISCQGNTYYVVKFGEKGRVSLSGFIQSHDEMVAMLKSKAIAANPSIKVNE